MRCASFVLAVLALALALAASGAAALAPEPQVIALDEPALFLETIGQDVGAVVEWYAPWCRWCKKFKKDYARLPARVADAALKEGAAPDEAAVIIAAVNVEANSDLAHKYGVEGLPTIQWIPPGAGADPGQAVLFTQKRSLKKLVPWVREQQKASPNLDASLLGALGSAAHDTQAALVLTSETFEQTTQDPAKNVLVSVDADWCEHSQALRPVLDRLAHIFAPEKNCQVARINAEDNLDVTQQFGVNNLPRIILFPAALDGTTDKFTREYTGERDEASLVAYMNELCGADRLAPSGWLNGQAGRLAGLEKLVGRQAAAVGHGYTEEAEAQAHHARAWIQKAREDAESAGWSEQKEASARVYERAISELLKHKEKQTKGGDWLGDTLDELENRLYGSTTPDEANARPDDAPHLPRTERDSLTVQANILRGILSYRMELLGMVAPPPPAPAASPAAAGAAHDDL